MDGLGSLKGVPCCVIEDAISSEVVVCDSSGRTGRHSVWEARRIERAVSCGVVGFGGEMDKGDPSGSNHAGPGHQAADFPYRHRRRRLGCLGLQSRQGLCVHVRYRTGRC